MSRNLWLAVCGMIVALAGQARGEGAASAVDVTAPAPGREVIRGAVVETTNASRYTYMRIQNAEGEVWAAGPRVVLGVGDEVEFSTELPKKNFHSEALDRTFADILFVSSVRVNGKPAVAATEGAEAPRGTLPAGHPDVDAQAAAGGLPAGHPEIGGQVAAALPAGHPDIAAMPSSPAGVATAAALQTGKVLQAMDAGPYTYLELQTVDAKLWVAAPRTSVKVGSEVRFETGVEMRDFESPSLKRTFESIFFVGGVEPVAK